MKKNKGFTLVELLISVAILTIVSLGFFAWATAIIAVNMNAQKNNTAYTIALDIAERLQRMNDNPLIQPSMGKCIGFDESGVIKECQYCGGALTDKSISLDMLTEYTNPWNESSYKIYMYDGNSCEGKTWLDSTCRDGITIQQDIANPLIDHPRTGTGLDYSSINPVRFINNTTYYAVWSITYLSCSGNPAKRKIFVTVYWLSPEPEDTVLSELEEKIKNGIYTIKSVSITVDKSIGIES